MTIKPDADGTVRLTLWDVREYDRVKGQEDEI